MCGIFVGHAIHHHGAGIRGRIVVDDDMVTVLRPVRVRHELAISFCRHSYLEVIGTAIEHAVAHNDVLGSQGLVMVSAVCHIVHHVYILEVCASLKGTVGQYQSYLCGIVACKSAAQVGEPYRLDMGVIAECHGIHGYGLIVIIGTDIVVDGHLAIIPVEGIVVHSGNLQIPHLFTVVEGVGGQYVFHVERSVTGPQGDIVLAECLVVLVGVIVLVPSALGVFDLFAEHGEVVVNHPVHRIDVITVGVGYDMVGILRPVGIALEGGQLVGTHTEIDALVVFYYSLCGHHLLRRERFYGIGTHIFLVNEVYGAQVIASYECPLLYHYLEGFVGLARIAVAVSKANLSDVGIALECQRVYHHRPVLVCRSDIVVDGHHALVFSQIMVAGVVHMGIVDATARWRREETVYVQTDEIVGMGTELACQYVVMPCSGAAEVCIVQSLSAGCLEKSLVGESIDIGIFACHLLPCHNAVGIVLPFIVVLECLHLVGPYADIGMVGACEHGRVLGRHLVGQQGCIAVTALVAIYEVDGLEVGTVGKGTTADGKLWRCVGAARHGVIESHGIQVCVSHESLGQYPCGAVGVGLSRVVIENGQSVVG